MQCGVLDYTLEQKQNISRKAGDVQREAVVQLPVRGHVNFLVLTDLP